MYAFTKIGNFNYWTDLLNPEQTAERFEQRASELRAKSSKEPNAGYGAWMTSRRSASYYSFALQQAKQVHGHAVTANGDPVCICGLVAETDTNDFVQEENALLLAPGHLNHNSTEIVTAFLIKQRSEETNDWPLHFFCQVCRSTQLAELTGDKDLDAILLADFRSNHSHAVESGDN